MHFLPIVGLSSLMITYLAATDQTDRYFSALDRAELTAYASSPNLSVYEMIDGTIESIEQPFCADLPAITAILSEDYAEIIQSEWEAEPNMTAQLWASSETETWTLLHVSKEGTACVASSGIGWTIASTKENLPDDTINLAFAAPAQLVRSQ